MISSTMYLYNSSLRKSILDILKVMKIFIRTNRPSDPIKLNGNRF